jgi:hypothetical protein
LKKDIPKADLLLVMGTSLQVAPVSMIPDMVRCNRVLFNRDKVMKIRPGDIFIPGYCDSNVEELSSLLGWTSLLQTDETETEELISHDNNDEELNEEELANLLGSCEINDDEQTNHTDKDDNDNDNEDDDDDDDDDDDNDNDNDNEKEKEPDEKIHNIETNNEGENNEEEHKQEQVSKDDDDDA